MENGELKKRISTGVMLWVVTAIMLAWANYFCAGRWFLTLAGLAVALICAWEFSRLCTVKEGQDTRPGIEQWLYALIPAMAPVLFFTYLTGTGLCGAGFCAGRALGAISIALAASFLAALFAQVILGRHSLESAKRIAAEVFPAVLYIGLGSCFLIALAASPGAVGFLLWLVVVVCVNDICAYFAGTRIGGAKLALELSPAKTYTGTLAGLAGGLVAGLILKGLVASDLGVLFVIFTLLVVLAAQAGDLGKSYFKRLYGEKDSGSIFPGHGGMLDRLDGILTAAPLVYIWYCFILG